MLSKDSLTSGTDEWGVRIRIFTATLTCDRASRIGLMNFTYTGETISSADTQDTIVTAVKDEKGKSGHLASGRSRHGHGEITYDSGAYYVGGWVRGKRAGKGRMVFPHGDTYDGEWLDGQYHGIGKYTSPDSDEYEGEWRNDKMCGDGRYYYRATGDVYEGGWSDGFREGFGKLTKANGDVFVGQYEAGELIKKTKLDKDSLQMGVDEDGKRIKFITATSSGNLSLAAGLGAFTYTGGTIASADAEDTTIVAVENDEGEKGHLASGRSRHGHGEIRYDSGAHYVGGWERGKRSGEGKFVHACGDSYEGGWQDGMYHGYGKYASSNSDNYEGEWKADKMEGHGKITHCDTGDVWEGTFVDGKKDGVGSITFGSGGPHSPCNSPRAHRGTVEQREYRAGELVVAAA